MGWDPADPAVDAAVSLLSADDAAAALVRGAPSDAELAARVRAAKDHWDTLANRPAAELERMADQVVERAAARLDADLDF